MTHTNQRQEATMTTKQLTERDGGSGASFDKRTRRKTKMSCGKRKEELKDGEERLEGGAKDHQHSGPDTD